MLLQHGHGEWYSFPTKKSGKTLEELGLVMDAVDGTARRAAWQFLNKTSDPRLSMFCRFAEAMSVQLKELI